MIIPIILDLSATSEIANLSYLSGLRPLHAEVFLWLKGSDFFSYSPSVSTLHFLFFSKGSAASLFQENFWKLVEKYGTHSSSKKKKAMFMDVIV